MSNPWLSIPLSDYEGHMTAPEVQQLDALFELFSVALDRCRPASLAVLGIAGGNGLEHVDPHVTKRVVGLDVSPLYLEEVRKRYAGRCNLELHCVNLSDQRIELDPVQLVHAALIFEHAGVDLCLENAVALVAPGGALSVVLQLPSEVHQPLGSSPFTSMQGIQSHFSFVEPAWFLTQMAERGFRLIEERQRSVPAGKRFWMGVFARTPAAYLPQFQP